MGLKSLVIFMTAVLLSGQCLFAKEQKEEKLADLVSEAVKNNPGIQQAYNLWMAAEFKIKSVKSLPDPMVNYGYFGEPVETRVGPQQNKFGASQKVPFPGKLGTKAKAQAKEAEALMEKYEAAKREVIKEVKFVYYDLYWIDKAVQVTEEEKAILESLEKVAQKRYELDLTPQQDVIKAQVELSNLINRLYVLGQNRKSSAAKLNSVLSRDLETRVGRIAGLGPLEFTYDLRQLHEIADITRQELLAANLDIERAKYERSLAKLDYLPDFTFGFDYIQVGSGHTNQPNDGQDAWMGSISVNVPLWFGKLKAQVDEKKAQLEAAKKSRRNLENSVSYEVDDLYFKVVTYKDIISLYKTALVPQAEQAFDASRIGYETGRVDFLNWLDSEKMLLQVRLAYYKAIVDYRKSIAYLERVVGKDL